MTRNPAPLLGIVAHDPSFAAVAARQRALLDDAAGHRCPRTTRRPWRRRRPEATP